MNQESISAYPLCWPGGWRRTTTRKTSRFEMTASRIHEDLLRELGLLGATNVVISTNVPLKRNGEPYAEGLDQEIADPGVAVFFERKGKSQCIASDSYLSPAENMRAVGVCVSSMRAMARHGASELLDRSFTGFTALPPKMEDRKWWEVLGVSPNATAEQVDAAFKEGAKRFHPDLGGDGVVMAQINRARSEYASQAR